jgi:cytoskeletal protein RodZ
MSTARNLILYVVYFVVVVALGAAIIFAFTGTTPTKKPVVKAPGTIHYTNNPSKQPHSNPSSTTPDAQSTPTSTATNTSGESVKAAIAAANPPAQLTNTGPGSTAAIFIISTVTASLLYRRRQLSRLS